MVKYFTNKYCCPFLLSEICFRSRELPLSSSHLMDLLFLSDHYPRSKIRIQFRIELEIRNFDSPSTYKVRIIVREQLGRSSLLLLFLSRSPIWRRLNTILIQLLVAFVFWSNQLAINPNFYYMHWFRSLEKQFISNIWEVLKWWFGSDDGFKL